MSEQAAAQEIARQCDGVLLARCRPAVRRRGARRMHRRRRAGRSRSASRARRSPTRSRVWTTARCKARIMRRADGTPWINSFAHGRTVYELKHDAAAVRAAMDQAADDAVVKTFVQLALVADLSGDEIEELRNAAAKRSGLGKRTVSTMLKAAQQEARGQAQTGGTRAPRSRAPGPTTCDCAHPARMRRGCRRWMSQRRDRSSRTALHPPARDIDGRRRQTARSHCPNCIAFTHQRRTRGGSK